MMNTSTPSLCTATLQVLLVTDCYPKTCFWYLHVLWVKTRQSISFEPSIIFRHARWEKNHYVVTCSFPICVIVFLAVSSVMLKLRYPAPKKIYLAMDQYLYISFLGGWTSIYQLFWCSPGGQGFDTLPFVGSSSVPWKWWTYSPWSYNTSVKELVSPRVCGSYPTSVAL